MENNDLKKQEPYIMKEIQKCLCGRMRYVFQYKDTSAWLEPKLDIHNEHAQIAMLVKCDQC